MGLCNEVVRWIYPPTVLDSDFRRRFALLSAAMRSLPLGTAYTIWDWDRGSRLICCWSVFSRRTRNADAHTRCCGDCSGPYYDETGILRYPQCWDGAICPRSITYLKQHLYARFSLISDVTGLFCPFYCDASVSSGPWFFTLPTARVTACQINLSAGTAPSAAISSASFPPIS